MKITQATLQIMLVLLTLGTLHSSLVQAHHAFTKNYNPKTVIQLSGVVTKFKLRSPHSRMSLEAATADGTVERWSIEMRSVPAMRRIGMEEGMITVGDSITVYAWPNKNPEKRLKVFGLGFITKSGALVGAKDMAGFITAAQIVAVTPTDPSVVGIAKLVGRWSGPTPRPTTASGPQLALTSAGQEAWENYNEATSPEATCEPVNTPDLINAPYLLELLIDENTVTFRHEIYNVTRTVPLAEVAQQVEASGLFGKARARLDGSELVIESSDYPASNWGLAIAALKNGNGGDVPSSTSKSLVERYSASDDGRFLFVDYTLIDPVYLAKAFTGRAQLTRVADDEPIYPYTCEHEAE